MGAIPARAKEAWDLSGPESPVDPCEDDAAEEEEKKGRGQQIFHGE